MGLRGAKIIQKASPQNLEPTLDLWLTRGVYLATETSQPAASLVERRVRAPSAVAGGRYACVGGRRVSTRDLACLY